MKATLVVASLLALSASAGAQDRYFIGASDLAPLSVVPANLELRLSTHNFGDLVAGTEISPLTLRSLVKAYGQSIDYSAVDYQINGLPAGLALENGILRGSPSEVGNFNISITASYGDTQISKTYPMAVYAQVAETAGVRFWSDGSSPASCSGYLTSTGQYRYSGYTGDGVYQVSPNGGSPIAVYCDMTRDGGGWAIILKQAQGDAVTLQGDNIHWTTGQVLNDTLANLGKNDGNLVSAAFTRLAGIEYRLEASNEATMKYKSFSTATVPFNAFNNSNRVLHTNYSNLPTVAYPDWFIRTTTYATSGTIGTASFVFNQGVDYSPTHPIICASRWGWIANNENTSQTPSHDNCGGLGPYGSQWASMGAARATWQPGTLYLWVK